MNKNIFLCFCLFFLSESNHVWSQNDDNKQNVNIHGTIRGKYEYQTEENKGRFEVRNARVGLEGNALKNIFYKAEIDLCDEGKMKMLDVFVRLKLLDNFAFTIGQMRVPFTVDAHRSPHMQYFANRSFIAKQVGNVRDVGAALGYSFNMGVPVNIEAGIFNGSGLTNQKDFWTNNINFSAKAIFSFPQNIALTLSAQKTKPLNINVMMYDVAATYNTNKLYIEGEYLYKHYENNAFQDVHAVDAFVSYSIPLKKCFFSKISPLIRYDFMSNHSDGLPYINSAQDDAGKLIINDYKRSRLTGGVTLRVNKLTKNDYNNVNCDIRINYEKYFYTNDAIIKPSEKDKFVIEFVTHF